ncbi:MAG: hypothetical protein LBE20_05685 [Deltaproteobacteria bacterium]|jgi:hypothetical protein|nr:hypothetical protein [Deltaproteobacteria bacterium]
MSRLKFICLTFICLLLIPAHIIYSATLGDFDFSLSEEKLICADYCCTYKPQDSEQDAETSNSVASEEAQSSQYPDQTSAPAVASSSSENADTNSSGKKGGSGGLGTGGTGNVNKSSISSSSSSANCLTLLTIQTEEDEIIKYEAFYKTFDSGASSWVTNSSDSFSRPYYVQNVGGDIHDCLKNDMNDFLASCLQMHGGSVITPGGTAIEGVGASSSTESGTWAAQYLLFDELANYSSAGNATTIANNAFWVGEVDDCLLDKTLSRVGALNLLSELVAQGLHPTQYNTSSSAGEHLPSGLTTNQVYIDASCNVVAGDPNDLTERVCGDLTINTYLTPLSLVWERIKDKPSFSASNFQLDPKQENKWYVWKASADMPLLVYHKPTGWFESENKIKVTSVEQLFGQYTFGKNWLDGFSALASLDKNQDGEVSGKELDNLYLWFDNNQNGVSEEGEVKDLKKAGVTTLYYKRDRDDTLTGDIVGIVGYKRIKDKQIVKGSIVDWMSKQAYSNKFDALVSAKKEEKEIVALAKKPYFGGVWSWVLDQKVVAKNMANIFGTFVMSDNGNTVKGISIIDIPTTSKSYLQTIGIRQFVPFVALRNEEANEIKFLTQTQDGLVTENTITLSEDGRMLYGVSRSEMWKTTAKKEKKLVHYTWKAYKKFYKSKS